MTYRNEILATVRRLLVSLLSLVRPSFKSIRSVLKSERSCEPFRCVLRPELPGMEQPFAGMLGRGCKAEASAGRRMRGMWKRRVRRRKRRGTKARKRERERGRASSNALQRQGGNTTGEERRQTAALRLGLALTRTCARTCSSVLIDRYRAPSSGLGVVGRCWESKCRIKNHLLSQVHHSVETFSIKRPLFPRPLCPTISDHIYAQDQLLS